MTQSALPYEPIQSGESLRENARPNPAARSGAGRWWIPLVAGLLVTLLQLGMLLGLRAPDRPWKERYLTLFQHDSYWFENIINRGYASPVPPIRKKMFEVSNVAFFPAYPLVARQVKRLTGADTKIAMLVTSQLAAWGFWSYLIAFLCRWNARPVLSILTVLLVAAHPAAFFLVAAYSESLFLALLTGFLFWVSAPGVKAKWLAMLHGFGMTATRIVGLPCALANIAGLVSEKGFWLASWRNRFRKMISAGTISAVSMLGGLGFFLFCQIRFGSWDFYMQTQEAGWGVKADYLALFRPETYRMLAPDWKIAVELSQFTLPFTMVALAMLLLVEIWISRSHPAQWRQRVPFYFSGLLVFYIAVSGVASVNLESMIRYQFCAHAIWLLALAHMISHRVSKNRALDFALAIIALLFAGASLSLQSFHAREFMLGGWVA